MSTTLLALRQRVAEAVGDFREFATSANISTTTGTSINIIASTLQNTDGGQNDYYNDWWVHLSSGSSLSSNIGLKKRVKDYFTTAGRLSVRGADLKVETSAVTCRLHRFDPDNYKRAIIRAIEQLFPTLYRKLEDRTMVTGNILPDNSFEMWTSASVASFYSGTNATLARTTTAGLIRGALGTTSMKVTATAANGYAFISSDDYPRLLDLMGRTVNFHCWAYPEVADDATIVIYTKQADGTAQTLTSTTTCPAGEYTKLELEEQALNDDLVEIQIRFKVTTNAKYVYFDSARLVGMNLYEYLLLSDWDDGHLSEVRVQTSGYSDEPCDDLNPRWWSEPLQHRTYHDGTYLYLRLKELHTNYRQIRLFGFIPLEALDADSDTISLEGEKLNLIVAQAAYELYKMEKGSVSAEDQNRYYQELGFWEREIRKLKPHLSMITPASTIFTGF